MVLSFRPYSANAAPPQRGRVPLTAEHPQLGAGPDLMGDERPGDTECVRPVRGDQRLRQTPTELPLIRSEVLGIRGREAL